MANLPIPDEQTYVQFPAATGTGPFPFNFSVFAKADLRVSLSGSELLQTSFTFSGIAATGGFDGGSITLNDDAAGLDLVIWREVTPARATDFAPANLIPVASIDQSLDRLTANAQDARRDIERAVIVPVGDPGYVLPAAEDRANTLLGFDALGQFQVYVANGLGVLLASLINFTLTAVGAVTRTLQARLGEEVYLSDFTTNLGDGVTDVSSAFVAAVTHLQNNRGGTLWVPKPAVSWLIAQTINVGDGNATPGVGGSNTKPPVRIKGVGAVSGVGDYAPNGGVILKSTVAGPLIKLNGGLGGGLEDLYITFGTASAAAIGVQLYEAQSCSFKRLTIQDPPGIGIDVETYGNKNCTFNLFEETFIFLGAGVPNAIGVKLSGPGAGSNTAFNSFNGLHITPSAATQKPLILGYADSNMFHRLDVNPTSPPCQAITLDYSTGDASFPTANKFYGLDIYNNTVGKVGTPNAGATASPNTVFGFGQINNTSFPPAGTNFVLERIKCSADIIIYVATTGNDTTGVGIYIGNPFATIQHAYDMLATNFDLNGFAATIKLANGTYGAGLLATKPLVGGPVTISGNSASPGSVVVSLAGNAFEAQNGATLTVQDLLISSSANNALRAAGGTINFQNVVFSSAVGAHVQSDGGNSVVTATGAYFVNGNAAFHFRAVQGGQVRADGITATVLANTTFTQYTSASGLGNVRASGYVASLGAFTVTGTRYIAVANSVIDVNGGGANIFPGTVAGSTATGGQYI